VRNSANPGLLKTVVKKIIHYTITAIEAGSGKFTSRGVGKRHLKSQGTSKLNAFCTATLTAKINNDGRTYATIHKSHYGHEISLGHLRIPENDRLAIAAQIADGVNFEHILDEIRDKIGNSYQRIHILTRKDVTNIKMTFCLSGNKRH